MTQPTIQALVLQSSSANPISYAYAKDKYELVKEYQQESPSLGVCLHCGSSEAKRVPAEEWAEAQYCPTCCCLNIVLVTDRMSGWWKDSVYCFRDR